MLTRSTVCYAYFESAKVILSALNFVVWMVRMTLAALHHFNFLLPTLNHGLVIDGSRGAPGWAFLHGLQKFDNVRIVSELVPSLRMAQTVLNVACCTSFGLCDHNSHTAHQKII